MNRVVNSVRGSSEIQGTSEQNLTDSRIKYITSRIKRSRTNAFISSISIFYRSINVFQTTPTKFLTRNLLPSDSPLLRNLLHLPHCRNNLLQPPSFPPRQTDPNAQRRPPLSNHCNSNKSMDLNYPCPSRHRSIPATNRIYLSRCSDRR